MLMNSRGGPPILEGGPPLGTISMDQTVLVYLAPKGNEVSVRHLKTEQTQCLIQNYISQVV